MPRARHSSAFAALAALLVVVGCERTKQETVKPLHESASASTAIAPVPVTELPGEPPAGVDTLERHGVRIRIAHVEVDDKTIHLVLKQGNTVLSDETVPAGAFEALGAAAQRFYVAGVEVDNLQGDDVSFDDDGAGEHGAAGENVAIIEQPKVPDATLGSIVAALRKPHRWVCLQPKPACCGKPGADGRSPDGCATAANEVPAFHVYIRRTAPEPLLDSDSFGYGGLGLTSGSGDGGTGWGDGIGLGTVGGFGGNIGGNIGGKPGSGTGMGYGGGTKSTKGVKMIESGVVVDGRLPPEVIKRIVRANFPRFRACYEQGLKKDPGVRGVVGVRFTIDSTGAVEVASLASSTLSNAQVAACVLGVYRTLSFPEPESGKVKVTYPIDFQPE